MGQTPRRFTQDKVQDTIVEMGNEPFFLDRESPRAEVRDSHGRERIGNFIPLRRAIMSPRKLCCFAMLATMVAFAVARRLNPYTTKSEVTPAAFAPIQSNDAKDLGAGKLLVASRNLGDPNFAKTVILLIQYDDQGVVGLILNRRTDIELSQVLEGVLGAKERSDPAYLGGPVEVPTVFALLQSRAKVEGAEHLFSSVYLISTKTLLEQTLAARPDPKIFHIYLGYAGWTPDQLRQEVELGAWFIFPADTSAVFNSDPGSLWPEMIRRTELKVAGIRETGTRSRLGVVKSGSRRVAAAE